MRDSARDDVFTGRIEVAQATNTSTTSGGGHDHVVSLPHMLIDSKFYEVMVGAKIILGLLVNLVEGASGGPIVPLVVGDDVSQASSFLVDHSWRSGGVFEDADPGPARGPPHPLLMLT